MKRESKRAAKGGMPALELDTDDEDEARRVLLDYSSLDMGRHPHSNCTAVPAQEVEDPTLYKGASRGYFYSMQGHAEMYRKII